MAEGGERKEESLWILRAQSGDKQALDRLLQAVQAPLYRYIVQLVRDRSLAEDVLQEVFVRIYRKLGWLREPELFRSWAYQIATREALRRIERERPWKDQIRDGALLESLAAPAPEPVLDADLRADLPASLAQLSPASRAVIVLFYLQEMSFGETAAVLGIPVGTVKSRLAYGLRKLREQHSAVKDEDDLIRRRFKRAILVFAIVELLFFVFVAYYKVRHGSHKTTGGIPWQRSSISIACAARR